MFIIIIPSILNLTSQIFKPQLVRKSWDSLNLVLVLFAIFCAFLNRGDNDGGNTSFDKDHRNAVAVSSSSRNQNQWYEYADRTGNNSLRSSNSYPDIRLESSWMTGDDGNYRFYDDTHLINHRVTDGDYLHRRSRRNREFDVEDSGAKNIHVDTFFNRLKEHFPAPPQAPSPPLPPLPVPPSMTVKHKTKRTYQTVGHEEKTERPLKSELELKKSQVPPPSPPPLPAPPSMTVKHKTKRAYQTVGDEETAERPLKSELELKKSQVPPPSPPMTTVKRKTKPTYRTLGHEEKAERPLKSELELKKPQVTPLSPPPPPPPPPPPLSPPLEKKNVKSDRKRGGATKDLLTLIYQQKRKKKQRQKSVENFDNILPPTPSLPEPPPPPQQPSAFHNLFYTKKNKTKKIHLAAPPPSAPLSKSTAQSQTNPITTHKPPLPVKTSRYITLDDNTSSGSDSQHTIPPPPPLPPFKMADWKFVVQGDYVRIKSNRSTGSVSPDMDDVGPSSRNESNQSATVMEEFDSGDSPPPHPPMFCSSPDVNTKADNFIARFRAGLKLEKMNSISEKQGIGLSKLGPDPSPSPDSDPRQI